MKKPEDWPDRRQRHEVELVGEVHYPDGHRAEALISNLSLEGCRLQGWYRIGDVLELSIPKIGRIRGQVRWALAGNAGIRFLPSARSASEQP